MKTNNISFANTLISERIGQLISFAVISCIGKRFPAIVQSVRIRRILSVIFKE